MGFLTLSFRVTRTVHPPKTQAGSGKVSPIGGDFTDKPPKREPDWKRLICTLLVLPKLTIRTAAPAPRGGGRRHPRGRGPH